jgi:hypothetical protein
MTFGIEQVAIADLHPDRIGLAGLFGNQRR